MNKLPVVEVWNANSVSIFQDYCQDISEGKIKYKKLVDAGRKGHTIWLTDQEGVDVLRHVVEEDSGYEGNYSRAVHGPNATLPRSQVSH